MNAALRPHHRSVSLQCTADSVQSIYVCGVLSHKLDIYITTAPKLRDLYKGEGGKTVGARGWGGPE